MPRETPNYRIVETWDTLGMRGTRSDDVKLDGVFVPDRYVARIVPAGTADAFVLGIFAWALMGFANVYCGIAQRAIDLAVTSVKGKTSLAVTRTMAYHPEIQHRIAQMVLANDTIGPHLDQVADDWSNGVDHGAMWPSKIVSAKHHAVETAWSIVDWAMDVSGGTGMFRGNELERLFRDARCDASIPQTHSSLTRSSPRRRSASTWPNSLGGDSAHKCDSAVARSARTSGLQDNRCRSPWSDYSFGNSNCMAAPSANLSQCSISVRTDIGRNLNHVRKWDDLEVRASRAHFRSTPQSGVLVQVRSGPTADIIRSVQSPV
jgi:hypothetical protein